MDLDDVIKALTLAPHRRLVKIPGAIIDCSIYTDDEYPGRVTLQIHTITGLEEGELRLFFVNDGAFQLRRIYNLQTNIVLCPPSPDSIISIRGNEQDIWSSFTPRPTQLFSRPRMSHEED